MCLRAVEHGMYNLTTFESFLDEHELHTEREARK